MGLLRATGLLFLIICLYGEVHTQNPVFLVHPQSMAAVEGSTVMFTCTANNSEAIDYRVNGTRADLTSITSQGFSQTAVEELGNNVLKRNLSVSSVSGMINNSMIVCEASAAFMGADDVLSDVVMLTVQGRLSSVGGLNRSFIDSTVNISWSPPFTLPGTDIIGYNVSATASNGTTANHFTSNSYYELSLTDISDSPCTEVIITVSGYNGLDGETSSITIPPPELSVPIDLNIQNNLTLMVQVNSSDACPPETSLTVTLSNTSDVDFVTINSSSSIVTYDEFTVREDLNYTVTVAYPIYDGDYTVTGSNSIDSYGVDSVNCANASNTVTCTCYFHSFSTDTICTVQLVQNGMIEYNGTFNRTSNNMAQGNISGVVSGVYNILAYDEGISDVVSASKEDVMIMGIIEPSTTTITSLMSMPNTSSSMSITENVTFTLTASPDGSNEPSPTIGSNVNSSTIIYIAVPVGVVIGILVALVVILLIVYLCCCKNRDSSGFSGERKESSDGLIGSSSFTDRSPTNPPVNMDDMYSRPNMEAKSANAPIVYAELSGFNKAQPKNNTSGQPGNQSKKDDGKVVYSDLMIKGQPPPPPYEETKIRETRLHSSATVIPPARDQPTKLLVEHPDEDIQEIFFLHNNNEYSDDETRKSPVTNSGSYPPPPSGRAPSPPEENDFSRPPPIPSRHHSNNQLPDVVRHQQTRPDNEEGYTDESMHPELMELTSKQDEPQGGYLNTPTATYL